MICTRKDFQQLAGISKANLSTYIKRGNVILDENGMIDTERRENKDFLERRKAKGAGMIGANVSKPENVAVKLPVSVSNQPIQTPQIPQIPVSKKVVKAAESTTISKYALELEKMQAELDKKIVDTRLAEQKLSILLGNNVPIEIVRTIIAQFSKTILTNYKSFAEQQITEICHQFRIDESERVKLTTKNINGLNAIHAKAVSDTRQQMKNAIGKKKQVESESNETEDDN